MVDPDGLKRPKRKPAPKKKAPAGPVNNAPGTEGMTPEMAAAVSKVIWDSGGKVWIKSGTRSRAEQQRLYDLWKAGKGNLAAKPGTSRHESGNAVDFGGDLKLAAKLAPKYGLSATVKGEDWHFSLGGAEGSGGFPYAPGAAEGRAGAGAPAGTTTAQATTAGTTAVPDLPPDATPEQVSAHIKRYYPQAAPFLNIPEIAAIFTDPGADEMDSIELEAKLRGTKYWQTHGAPSRALDALYGSDKQAADALVTQVKRTLSDLFAKNGVGLSDHDVSIYARKALRAGYVNLNGQVTDPDAINEVLVTHLKTGGALPAGEASNNADGIIAKGKQFLVPISRSDAEAWSLRILQGKATEESLTSWLSGLAKARYASQPDVLAAIDGGMTPSQYFAGHKTTVAGILELGDEQIDLLDPKWSWMIETVDKNGNRRAPTLGEVQQMARDRPEFSSTRAYKETSADYALNMSKFIGATA